MEVTEGEGVVAVGFGGVVEGSVLFVDLGRVCGLVARTKWM